MNTPLGRSKRAFTFSALAVAALAFVSPDGQAAASQSPELVLFCADWSPSCKHDQSMFERDMPGALKQANLNVRVRIIDADKNPELLKKYNVEYVPAVFVKTHDDQIHEFLDERLTQPIVDFAKQHSGR